MNKVLNKYRKMSVTSKASIWFLFCNLFQKGISTITVPFFTRLLSPTEYGTYSLYLSWFNILTIITSLNIYYGSFYNALNRIKDKSGRDQYVSSMQGLTITLTMILVILFFPFQDFWSGVLGLDKIVIWMLLFELLAEPAVQFWLSRQRFDFKYKSAVIITALKCILNPVLGLILVCITKYGRDTLRIFSVVLAEIIVAGSIMAIQFIRGKSFFSKKNWKFALNFNIPLLPHHLSAVLLNQADRVMIESFDSRDKVAIYSVAYNIGLLIQLFTNAINNTLNPWTYDKLNKKDYAGIKKTTNMLLLLIAGAIICMLFFVPEAVFIFGGEEYYEAIYVVPPVACSVFFIFMYNIFAIPQMYFEKQKMMSVISVSAALLNILLNYIFINLFGYLAAGYTTLVCYVLYSMGHLILVRRVCKIKLNGAELYDLRVIFSLSLLIVICSVLFDYVYSVTPFVRYGLFAVIFIIIISKRKKITGLIKSLKAR